MLDEKFSVFNVFFLTCLVTRDVSVDCSLEVFFRTKILYPSIFLRGGCGFFLFFYFFAFLLFVESRVKFLPSESSRFWGESSQVFASESVGFWGESSQVFC